MSSPLVSEDAFFSGYLADAKKIKGIPYLEMNCPLAPPNTFKGTIGMEIEVEGRRLPRDGGITVSSPTTGAIWLGHEDHSLRGESREYVLSAPVTSDELEGMVEGLFEAFAVNNTKLINSNRCSTHVHINMNGKRINQVTSLLCLWACFEQYLIRWCGEERQSNHFCLSLSDAATLPNAWNLFLRTGAREWPRDMKYSAINLLPLWDRGSVEFRCGAAADDPVKPVTWGLFLNRLVNFATTRYPNPRQIAYDLSERGGAAILEEICGKQFHKFFKEVTGLTANTEAFNKGCMAGFRNVQSVAMGFPWDTWIEVIEREFIPNPFSKAKAPPRGRRGVRLGEMALPPQAVPELRRVQPD